MIHIRPETDDAAELLPHSLILPNGLAALLDKWLNAIFLNLFLAADSDQLFDLNLNRQTVSVPARLAEDFLALH